MPSNRQLVQFAFPLGLFLIAGVVFKRWGRLNGHPPIRIKGSSVRIGLGRPFRDKQKNDFLVLCPAEKMTQVMVDGCTKPCTGCTVRVDYKFYSAPGQVSGSIEIGPYNNGTFVYSETSYKQYSADNDDYNMQPINDGARILHVAGIVGVYVDGRLYSQNPRAEVRIGMDTM